MRELRELQTRWDESGRFRNVRAQLSLEDNGLVLGVGTVLAKRDAEGALALEGRHLRLAALLAAAYGGPIDISIFRNIARASHWAKRGDKAMAAMQLALARVPRLDDPREAARRLFIADGLIDAGVDPRDIWAALEFDSDEWTALEKLFNQQEPRNPGGEHHLSGEWTKPGAGEATGESESVSLEAADSQIGEDIAEAAVGALTRVPREGTPLGALDALNLMMGTAGRDPVVLALKSRPDLKIIWSETEGSLRIYQPPNPSPVAGAVQGPGRGLYSRGKKIARLEGTKIAFDLDALNKEVPKRNESPQQCPDEKPDRPGSRKLDLDYEDFIKKQNNVPPTKRGFAYWLMNPIDHRSVVVDDCIKATNTPVEIKRGYAGMVSSFTGRMWTGIDWIYQATRQEEAWYGRPIEWDFSERAPAEWAKRAFSLCPWLKNVDIEWKPWKGGE